MAAKDADALRANMQLLDVFLDHRAASPFPGDWESVFRGPGYEFWGMRTMERGDSYKQIDWKTRAKTGRYFVREHLAESHAHLAILCDCSRSMAFGQKDLLQADIAVSLAYSAIAANNACGIVFFADGIVDAIPARMGLDHFERLLAAVAEQEPVACKKTDAKPALAHVIEALPESLTVVLSDFLYPFEAPRRFDGPPGMARPHEVKAIQILGDFETTPPIEASGLLALRDSETGRDIVVDLERWKAAGQKIERKLEKGRQRLRESGIDVLTLSPSDDWRTEINAFLAPNRRARGAFP